MPTRVSDVKLNRLPVNPEVEVEPLARRADASDIEDLFGEVLDEDSLEDLGPSVEEDAPTGPQMLADYARSGDGEPSAALARTKAGKPRPQPVLSNANLMRILIGPAWRIGL